MPLSSRLALPALLGGLLMVFASGVFAPPVQARGYHVDTLAQVTGVAGWDHLNVRRWPASYSQRTGQLAPLVHVWVERCIQVERSSDWCLVERDTIKGWVNSKYLTPADI
ncbi:hypothetical protein [Pelagibacterium halotolerans]|uniref:SH3b domain-containing protein n=1 Tax=Pelagibacterium halotolerans (strain DSM 22347 / JCM 15775 / CGMCC 1.7692 / B2) TaxID=1082931 RepID=G4RCH7_PELHB|nr:hypothetical protein [Pelagibacterium halotolerans]AEQ50649.1 hypothetical protein KKY_610 [Pelagibacterium halotolerans B2]QJR19416.1 hypothetical protein HKM20_13780 [Pelagibacterium halotolerans]SDZ92043.1 hypothetical protein SAMN05428936_101539 [Pelagibacterium halotolerans]